MRDKTTINRLKMYKSGGKAIRCDNNCDFNGQSSCMVQIHVHFPMCFTHFLIVVGVGTETCGLIAFFLSRVSLQGLMS